MKKILTTLCAVAMLAGCTAGGSKKSSTNTTSTKEETAATVMVGTGSVTNVANKVKEGADTTAQFDTTFASVVLEGNVIKYVYFDVAQDKVTYDATGHVTSDNTTSMSKKDLGDNYGMKDKSPIKKEWFEQVEALEKWAVGKTVEEVLNMPTTQKDEKHTVPADKDLMTGCTIGVTGFQQALEKAVKNAVEVKDVASVGSAILTEVSGKDATAEKSGEAKANSTYGVVALDKDGKVVFTQTDVAQNAVKFTTAGVVDGEAIAVATKGEKKDEYGMKKASAIGKEWFEQNQAFDEWTVGKTSKEISGMEVTTNEAGKTVTADKDLMTGCTMGIDSLQKVTVTAIAAASKLN